MKRLQTKIEKVLCILAFLPVASGNFAFAQNVKQNACTLNIVPQPQSVQIKTGTFLLNSNVDIVVPVGDGTAPYVKNFLQQFPDIERPGAKKIIEKRGYKPFPNRRSVVFEKVGGMGKEEYFLDVSPSNITVKFTSPNGAFYAVQTLSQLCDGRTIISKDGEYNCDTDGSKIQCVVIKDKPRFSYRGVHLCVGSHVFSMDFIKKYIDEAAKYKMNVFHWHLTEDQGWRLEIKKYPELTKKGSIRKETVIGTLKSGVYDGMPYGGYYTQEQAKEIVKYAAERYVTVIPEIEMPGHSLGALHCFPNLSCDSTKTYEVATKWGVFKDVYCPKDETFKFLEDVLTEVFEIFPSEYIHIGGDECPKTAWKNSVYCQDLMKKLGLKDEMQLQSYFIQRMEKFINAHGRKIIGWDEILQGGLAPNATVMSWLGVEGGIKAAKQHHNAIMAPYEYYYLDYYQANPDSEPLSMGDVNTLKKMYTYEPVSNTLTPEEQKYIIGVEGCLWTEYVTTPDRAWYQAYPRTLAIAESAWTMPEHKSWDSFTRRVEKGQLWRLRSDSIKYCDAFHNVYIQVKKDDVYSKVVIMELDAPDAVIHYTTDGSEPTENSSVYKIPFVINKQTVVKARGFSGGKAIGVTKQAGW